MKSFDIQVASDVRRDDIFVEITYNREIMAELAGSAPGDTITITLFPRPDGSDWTFAICELQAALERARQRMLLLQQPLPAETPAD
jgi:hypothetical protein